MKIQSILKKVGIISCAVILTIAVAGGVMAIKKPTKTTQSEQPIVASNNLPSQTLASVNESYIGDAKAKEIALTHAGVSEADISYMICKLDYDNGIAEYEVEFWNGLSEYDYEINAVNGDIISYDYDMETYDTNPITTSTTPTTSDYIGDAKAKEIALTHAGVMENETSYIKCEFDFDDGYAEYEVEWKIGKTEYEYTISAIDGTILERDIDYD